MNTQILRGHGLLHSGVILLIVLLLDGYGLADFHFTHHVADRDIGGGGLGQTALVDVDHDGDLDFITAHSGGTIRWYEYRTAGKWIKHVLGEKSPSDVGAKAFDVNGDGWVDFVAGGAWYENPRKPSTRPFTRHVFDKDLRAVHDLIMADIDGNGSTDIVTMSDRNDVRWYSIAKNPGDAWSMTRIGESVHSGISAGDLDGDGDLDVVRSNIWFENLERGTRWAPHRMTAPWGTAGKAWQRNSTQTRVADINLDGRMDVVIADGECSSARIGWLEAPADPKSDGWKVHYLVTGDQDDRAPYHSLQLGDFDRDGDIDIFTCEMEHIGGARPPRWFIWENVDGKGARLIERVILDVNLGGHEAVVGDVDGDGDLDICSKPWRASRKNANGGKPYFIYLENRSS